jgi:hypothetical protein
VVEYLPSICEALGSIYSTEKKDTGSRYIGVSPFVCLILVFGQDLAT